MRPVLRLRQLAVQRTWCRSASGSMSRRSAASLALKPEEVDFSSGMVPVVSAGPSSQTTSTTSSPEAFESFFTSTLLPTYFEMDKNDQKDIVAALEEHINTPSPSSSTPCTIQHATTTWHLYEQLAPSTRKQLSHSTLRAVLEQVAAHENVQSNRFDRIQLTDDASRRWGRRLQIVLRDLQLLYGVQLQDMSLAMRRLARHGDVEGTEELWTQISRRWPDMGDEKDSLLAMRLASICKFAKSAVVLPSNDRTIGVSTQLQSPRARALEGKGVIMLRALWSILTEYTSNRVVPSQESLKYLTVAINLTRELYPTQDFSTSLDSMLEHILKQAYSINLPYLARKAEAGQQLGKDLQGLQQPAVNALIQWLARRGETWKMVAASELFQSSTSPENWVDPVADEPKAAEPVVELADKPEPLVQAKVMEPAEEQGDYGPTLKDAEAAYKAENDKLDWFGREKKPSLVADLLHQHVDKMTDSTSIVAEKIHVPPRTYKDFYRSTVPQPLAVSAHVDEYIATRSPRQLSLLKPYYGYGTCDTTSYLLMFAHLKKANDAALETQVGTGTVKSDLTMAMHVARSYISSATRSQALWVRSVLTQYRSRKTVSAAALPETLEARMQAYKDERVAWKKAKKSLPVKRKHWIDKQLSSGAEETQDLAAVEARAKELFRLAPPPIKPVVARSDNWIARLQPPPVAFSPSVLNFPVWMVLEAGRPTLYMKELDAMFVDALERMRQEHFALSGRRPSPKVFDRDAYVRTMRERGADEVDPSAPFDFLFSGRGGGRVVKGLAFDPVQYLYSLARSYAVLRGTHERLMERKAVALKRRRRQNAARAWRASHVVVKSSMDVEGEEVVEV